MSSTLGFNLTGSAIQDAARRYVADGESLATFLTDLEVAHQALDLGPPSTQTVKAASLAWADEILGTIDGVACENPLTGLSSPDHARLHLRALYRLDDPRLPSRIVDQYAVVVVSLLEADRDPAPIDALDDAFDRSLRLATVGETIRTAFDRCDVLTALPHGRVLAVVGADQFLTNRADELAWLLRRRLPVSSAPRVVVESMPATEELAFALLESHC